MTQGTLENIELRYREGSSDKVYRAAVEASGDGFVVNFAFGRRGATLSVGTKTQEPVALDEAMRIYERLVASKTAKGYKHFSGGVAGIGMVKASAARADTGLRAQLLNPLDSEEDAEPYLANDWWCTQEKHDGRRLLVRKSGQAITAANRRGQASSCPAAVHAALCALPGDFVIDGECVGETYFTFDLLGGERGDLRGLPYGERLRELGRLLPWVDAAVVTVATAYGEYDKRAMLARLRSGGREGIVLKDLRAHWSPWQTGSGGPALKYKFWQTCSCVVTRINARRSVALELAGIPCGNVTIPPSHAVPQPGQVVEVRYLYVTGPGGALFQPVYLGLRGDVEPAECTPEAQRLKYKAAA